MTNPAMGASVGLATSALAVAYVLGLQQRVMQPQAATPGSSRGGYDDDVEQALSDNNAEAAPMLTHPQKDVLATVVAGGVAGAAAKTAVAPLARLTILYQVQALQPQAGAAGAGRSLGLVPALRQVIQQEGLASLWKGNLATIIHRVPYSAVNFTTFEYTKKALDSHVNDTLKRLIAGAAAGLAACSVAYPLDLVRTRLAAQRDMLPHVTRFTPELAQPLGVAPNICFPTPVKALPDTFRPPRHYKSIRHAFQTILREEGVLGLYRGLTATLVQVTPTLALNFCLYDSFKAMYLEQLAAGEARRNSASAPERAGAAAGVQLDLTGSLVCAAGSGFFTSTLTFPLDVVRKRMQTSRLPLRPREPRGAPLPKGSPAQGSYFSVCRQILDQQGYRGFYAGIMAEYCKVLPGMAIAFALYEGIKGAAGVPAGD